MMRQAIHIFQKDVRQLWIPVVAVLALTIWFSYNAVETWDKAMNPEQVASKVRMNRMRQVAEDQGALTFDYSGTVSGGAADLVVPIMLLAWFFLIVRLIHAEAIPGDRQFWLTRPYNRKSLLAAKALFVMAFVNLPMLVAQAAILAADGLPVLSNAPGLFWEQVLLTTVIILPALALAAMTATVAQFIGWALVICVAVAITAPYDIGVPMEWARSSFGAGLICLITISVLLLQFIRRKTRWSRVLTACGMVFTWVVASSEITLGAAPVFFVGGGIGISERFGFMFPWKPILAIQTRMAKPRANPPRLELVRVAPAGPRGWFDLGLRATGLPEGARLVCNAAEVSVDNAAGSTWRSGILILYSGVLRPSDMCPVTTYGSPDASRKFGDQPVRIHVSLYLTVFDDERSTSIPLDTRPVPVPAVGPCAAAAVSDAPAAVWCRVAFRWPSRLVTVPGSPGPMGRFNQLLSYSPFPADLRFDPVETRWMLAKPDVNGMVDVTATQTMWFVRADLDISNVRLTDF